MKSGYLATDLDLLLLPIFEPLIALSQSAAKLMQPPASRRTSFVSGESGT